MRSRSADHVDFDVGFSATAPAAADEARALNDESAAGTEDSSGFTLRVSAWKERAAGSVKKRVMYVSLPPSPLRFAPTGSSAFDMLRSLADFSSDWAFDLVAAKVSPILSRSGEAVVVVFAAAVGDFVHADGHRDLTALPSRPTAPVARDTKGYVDVEAATFAAEASGVDLPVTVRATRATRSPQDGGDDDAAASCFIAFWGNIFVAVAAVVAAASAATDATDAAASSTLWISAST
jgi:hypothetical protein